MESQRQAPPGYAYSHHPDNLKLPSVPQQELHMNHAPADITLPDLKSVLADLPPKTGHPNAFSNAVAARELDQMGMPRTSIESDAASNMSLDDGTQRSTSVSMDDPDVRLAAEALSGLGNPDFARSPKTRPSVSKPSPARTSTSSNKDLEPLLDLLVDAHPWVGNTVNGSLSAYNATKNFSPRIVRYGVHLVERNVGSPVASTVSNIGRRTGVEGGIRRYLDSRRPSSPAMDPTHGSKRRRVTSDDMEIDRNPQEPGLQDSQEFLPAYQANKPPSYRKEVSPHGSERSRALERPPINRSWSTKIFISTSALGVALSDSSLRSLQYCVKLLSSATEHVESVMNALKMVLHEYDQSQEVSQQDRARREKETEAGIIIEIKSGNERDQSTEMLARRIKSLCDDIWHTIQTVVNSVSTYAGGALPENARNIVKGQLLSIPQRWRCATQSAEAASPSQSATKADGGEDGKAIEGQNADENTRKAAHRMIAFATEGLDMMAQVNNVVGITLQSAENWLQSLGRNNREEEMMDADDPRESATE
ncbi:transcription factor Opi1 [Aureobasidium pullulans]|uniref:Transcription factor Opi1 n=1 Tax=Aureobasidium pullulans TaxID=5580 RepID=A0A4S9KVU1_AURPU|nr:transcription factor Opi1 [Aureobasidium pullulans]